jgi:8-amino-7-oxononanoate synthase
MTSTSRFSDLPGLRKLERRIATQLSLADRIPFFRPHQGVNSALIDLGQGPLINFSSYNYLGLSGHPEVSAAAKAAIDRYGTSVSASRIVSGEIPLHRELELEIADFVGAADSLVFVGGYSTNVTTITHLYGRRDLIVYDELCHNSLFSGTQFSQSEKISFQHNNMAELDRVLGEQRRQFARVLVLTEGLFSMHGDLPDYAQLIKTCRHHDVDLMVDEAHSIGVLGATGRGIAEFSGMSYAGMDIQMGTLSKSLASCGGFIAGDARLIRYLRFLAPGFIFSVGLPPADTAAALAALRILRREPERVQRLRENSIAFRRYMHQASLAVDTEGTTPIIPVLIGDQYECMQISHELLQLGVHVQPVVYPAVPLNGALLRFFIGADHTFEQLEIAVGHLSRLLSNRKKPA